jgi:hypothetical protein
MKPLLALSFGLLLGQTPPSTTSLPVDADVQDSAAIAFRDAWEEALEDASAADTAQPAPGTVASMLAPSQGTGVETAQVSLTPPVVEEGTGGSGSDASSQDTSTQSAGDGTQDTSSQAPLTLQQMSEEVRSLRSQVQTLQGQLETQQQQGAAVAQGFDQTLSDMRGRAQELEQLRTQNLSLMQDASTWLAAADQALDTGELDVDNALSEADAMLAEAVENASAAGRGNAAAQVQSARSFISQAMDAAGRRDVYYARWALLYAADRLRAAHSDTLDEEGTSVLTP